MTLPTFLVIGAQKAGSTSLWDYLRRHPQIFMSERKELHFFIEQNRWRGIGWYEEQFAEAGDALAIGEASPGYTMHPRFPGVPERIAETIPNAKFVYVLRHPIERMRSHYWHRILAGSERRSIERALCEDPDYLNNSRYSLQIERYLDVFPPDRLHVLLSERLRASQSTTLREVYSFIGVDPDWRDPNPEAEWNVSAARDRQRRVVRWLTTQQVRGRRPFKTAAERMPEPVKRRIRRTTHSPPVALDTTLSLDLERELVDQLAEDLARLSRYVPGEFDAWGLLTA